MQSDDSIRNRKPSEFFVDPDEDVYNTAGPLQEMPQQLYEWHYQSPEQFEDELRKLEIPPKSAAEFRRIRRIIIEQAERIRTLAWLMQSEGTGINAFESGADAYYRGLLTHLAKIERDAQKLARSVTIAAVDAGYISRVQAGKMLGVHQATVARWLKEAKESRG